MGSSGKDDVDGNATSSKMWCFYSNFSIIPKSILTIMKLNRYEQFKIVTKIWNVHVKLPRVVHSTAKQVIWRQEYDKNGCEMQKKK